MRGAPPQSSLSSRDNLWRPAPSPPAKAQLSPEDWSWLEWTSVYTPLLMSTDSSTSSAQSCSTSTSSDSSSDGHSSNAAAVTDHDHEVAEAVATNKANVGISSFDTKQQRSPTLTGSFFRRGSSDSDAPLSPVSRRDRISGRFSVILGTITGDKDKVLGGHVKRTGVELASRKGERVAIE
ncbi:hypothetical protein ACM66B_002100 [Microbotryomycetes sp. NB124-2]